MIRTIHVKSLSFPCITRKRGEEAAYQLQEYSKAENIVIDLSTVEMISFSFLDGLISKTLASSSLDKIVFRTTDPLVVDKLGRIAALRNISIYYKNDSLKTTLVAAKHSPSYKTTFVYNKSLLRL